MVEFFDKLSSGVISLAFYLLVVIGILTAIVVIFVTPVYAFSVGEVGMGVFSTVLSVTLLALFWKLFRSFKSEGR